MFLCEDSLFLNTMVGFKLFHFRAEIRKGLLSPEGREQLDSPRIQRTKNLSLFRSDWKRAILLSQKRKLQATEVATMSPCQIRRAIVEAKIVAPP